MASSDTRTFHSTTSRVIALVGWAAAVLGAVASVAIALGGRPARLFDLAPPRLLALLLWEAFWRPRVTVNDSGVQIVDIFRTTRIPWTTVIDVQTRWALTIVTPRRRYRASAAPAPGARARPLTGRAATQPALGRDGGVLVSDALGTDSGDAAAIVRATWRRLLDEDRIEIAAPKPIVPAPASTSHPSSEPCCCSRQAQRAWRSDRSPGRALIASPRRPRRPAGRHPRPTRWTARPSCAGARSGCCAGRTPRAARRRRR